MKAEALQEVWRGSVAGSEVSVLRGGEGDDEWLIVNVYPPDTGNSALLHVKGRTASFGHVGWQQADQEVQEIRWTSMVDL